LFLQEQDERITSDPLLIKYYGSISRFEGMFFQEREDYVAETWPNNDALWDQYTTLKGVDPDAAGTFFEEHPSLAEESQFRATWDVKLRARLEHMTDGIANLEEQFPQLRLEFPEPADAREAVLRQAPEDSRVRTVQDLIAGKSLQRYELPSNLSARELRGAIRTELDSIPDGQWSAVGRALDAAGNLDRTRDAFQEVARGETGLDVIELKMAEFGALLVALEQIREQGGWELGEVTGEEVARIVGGLDIEKSPTVEFQPKISTGGGSGSRPRRRRSSGGGGGGPRRSSYGGAPATPQQAAQASAQVGQFLVGLRNTNPDWWALLRRLTGMTSEQRAELLAANPAFARALLGFPFPLSAITAYFNQPPAHRTGSRSSSGARRARFSSPRL
jgi:hypothetical protein